MRASSSSEQEQLPACGSLTQISISLCKPDLQIDTSQIYPEGVLEFFDARASYLNTRIQGLNLISYSMTTTLSPLQKWAVVTVLAYFSESDLVSERIVEGLFGRISGLTALCILAAVKRGHHWMNMPCSLGYLMKVHWRNGPNIFALITKGVSEAK